MNAPDQAGRGMGAFMGGTLPLILLALLVGRFVGLGFSLAGLPDAALYHLYEDDSFYFLEIAWNWSRGLGSSFDGLHATNGYQPLWQWVLVPLAALSEDRPEFAARFQLLVTLLHAAAAVGLFAALRRASNAWAAAIAAWLLLFAPGATLLSRGMESALYALLLAMTFLLWCRRGELRGKRRVAASAALGVVAALTALARLEAGLLVVLLGATLLLGVLRGRERPEALAALVAGASLVLVPYLIGNRVAFGDWMPVSVVMKSSHGHFRSELLVQWAQRLFLSGGLPIALGLDHWPAIGEGTRQTLAVTHALVLFGLVGSGAVMAARRGAHTLPFLLFLLLHWLIVGSGSAAQWPVAWHFVPEVVAMAVLGGLALGVGLPALLARIPESPRRITLLVGAPLATALVAMHLWAVFQPVSPSRWLARSNSDEAVRWIEHELPPEATLGSFDSGFLGWALEQPVVNLDGVANDFEYLEDFHLPKRHGQYFEREDIDYLVNLTAAGEDREAAFRRVPRATLREMHRFEKAPGAPVVIFEIVGN